MPFITNYLTDSDHPLRTSQVERGKPTWRRLVEAVEDPVGGNNHALALKIAAEHPGMHPGGGTIFALGAYNENAGNY